MTLGCALLSFLAIGVGPGAAVSTAAACDAIDAAVPADRAGWAVAGLPANVSHAARKHALTMTAAANGGPARSTLPQRVPASNLDVSIILDTASAMPAKAIAAGEATAAGLLETLPPDARVSLVTAGGKPMLVSRGRGESAKTVSTIRTLRRRPGHALYDAMLLAAQSMSRDAARADVVVVIAGGPDDTSFSSLDAASAALARQGALLHVLDVGHQPAMPSLGPQCPSSDVTAPLTTAAATKLGSGLADQVTGLYWIPVPGASADGYLSLHAAAGHQSATGKFGVKPAPIASPAQSSDSLPIGPGILLAAIGVGAMAFGGVVLVMGLAADREGGGRIRRPRLPRRAHHAPAPPVPVRHAAAGRPLARRRTDEVLTLPVAAPAAAREARRPATARVAMPRRVVASAAAPPRPVLHAATGRAVFSAAPAPVPEAAATGPAVVQPVPAPTAPAPTAPASAAAAAVRPAAVRPAQVAPLTVPPQPPGRRRVRTPRVRVPRLPVPHLRMPHVRLPHVRLPHVRLPHVRLPHVRLPHVRASRPRTPQVTTMPRVSMPAVRLHLPRLHLPRPHLPRLHAPHLHLPQLRVLHARRRSGRLRHRRAPVGPLTARLVRVLGVALLPLLVGVRTVMNPQWWAGVRDDPADIALIAVALVLVALGLRRLWVATSEPDAVDLRRLQRMSRLEDADEKVLSYTRTVVFSVSAPPAASPAPAAVAADAAGATSAPAPIGVAETPLPEPATEAPPEMAGVPLSEPATEPLPEPVVAADVRPVAFHVRQAPPVSPHRARRRRVPRFPTLPSLFLLAPAAVLLFML